VITDKKNETEKKEEAEKKEGEKKKGKKMEGQDCGLHKPIMNRGKGKNVTKKENEMSNIDIEIDQRMKVKS
jgi:hypothetical protein